MTPDLRHLWISIFAVRKLHILSNEYSNSASPFFANWKSKSKEIENDDDLIWAKFKLTFCEPRFAEPRFKENPNSRDILTHKFEISYF